MRIPGLLLFLKLITSTLFSFFFPPIDVQSMTQQGLVLQK